MGFDGFELYFESSGTVLDHLSVDSSRDCRCSFFMLVDGVVEFLHRGRLHSLCLGVARKSPRVRVRVSSSLKCGASRKFRRTHLQYPFCRICCCRLCPACVCCKDFLRLVLCRVFF